MKKIVFLLSMLLTISLATASLAQHGHGGGPGGPGSGGPGGGGLGGGPGGGGPGGGQGQKNANKIGGTVSNLATDGSSFTITGPHGETATVHVSSMTTITTASDGTMTTLANGENVQVTGKFDSTGKIFTATAIVVDDRQPGYFGTVASLATDGSSFTLQGHNGDTLTVDVSSTTTITNHSDGSIATLANGENVLVAGTLDSTGKIVTATAIVVDDHKPPTKLQMAIGTILALDTTDETLVLTVTKANFTLTGTTITVVTNAKTAFCSPNGKITFADLMAGAKIRVAGTFNTTTQTLTATRIDVSK